MFSEKYNEQKSAVQKILFVQFGVRVDQVLQGHGTTPTEKVQLIIS